MTDKIHKYVLEASEILKMLVRQSTELKSSFSVDRRQEELFRDLQVGLCRVQRLLSKSIEKDYSEKRSTELWTLISNLFPRVIDIISKLLNNSSLFCKLTCFCSSYKKMSLGKTIKLLRISSGLKQKELAPKLGITPNYLSLVENDKREPSMSFLRALAGELDLPLGLFLWDTSKTVSVFDSEQKKIYEEIKNLIFKFQRLRTQVNRK